MDKTWIWLPRNSHEYSEGATNFVNSSARRLGSLLEMLCPCRDCRNLSHQSLDKIVEHLVIRGMDKKYKSSRWSIHGEKRDSAEDSVLQCETEAFDLFKTAFSMDEGGPNPTTDNEDDEAPEELEFTKKLRDAQTPLYSGCLKHTKVSAIMGLYRFKVKSGVSENYFDQLLVLLEDLLPEDNVLPKSLAAIKKFLKIFGFGYDNIHACKNDCILYRKEYENLQSCPRCKVSRWEMDKHSNEIKVGIPAKVLRYFPIKDRFRRMFRSKRMAEDLRWHYTNATEDGTMRHPVDSISWAQVNAKWPDFAADPRNLRLGISTDGMNPFSMQSTNHSTWPVLLVNYNTPPTMCMKAENIMLTLLIPGPTAPGNNIDVYLAPLIDDLKDLWAEGIEVYDSFAKENFNLRALLLWSISDYPALGTLSGCKVKGKQACNVCGKDTPARWLKFSRKFVYMGNRRRLPPGHRYRYKKAWFDNTVEEVNANRIQTGAEIYETLQAFTNDFGRPLEKEKKRKRLELEDDERVVEEECDESNELWRWKKRSIFFDLPYWKELPVRHNIDVMHVEKNVSDAILSLLMQSAKSKDGLKARKDLEDIGIRKHLHTEVRGKKTYLPPAAYWLSKKENQFTSADIMFHLPIHLSKEARLGGPVHFRWMYPFERYMKTLKAFVKNYARPEACMAEAYLAGECVAFCLEFLKDSVPVQEAVNRNEDVETDTMVVEGRPLQKGIEVTLSDKDRDIAHRYVLMNMASLDPFLEMHLEELQAKDARLARNETLLWKYHTDHFAEWLKNKIHSDSTDSHSKEIRWLAFGPRNVALAHKGFIINGQRFHTDAVKLKTQNSGVTYEAFSMCRSSARDMRQVADMITYYGVIKEILVIDYHMFKVPLFRCNWANTANGVKEEDGFTLVNLHMNQAAYLKDPFILPSQAKQVFYSREDDASNWYVVMRAPPRGYHELETEEDLGGAPLPVQEVDDMGDEASDDDSVYVRDDCEGLLVVD
ncbi:uncharacterized protein LOC108831992 [Raphanus sativus]|uniref:Uncharacterized protein LOC108831992 n=1 Tax=Raphanus sativus TaxID=3726 RepID=A0A9W3BVI2_RAPSA|nr:uncharacterized protein LOC108831992 [Raphanus sativus]